MDSIRGFSQAGYSYPVDEARTTGDYNSHSVSNKLSDKLKSIAITVAKVAIAALGLITLASAATLMGIFVSPIAGIGLGAGAVGAVVLIAAGIFLAKEEGKENARQKLNDGDTEYVRSHTGGKGRPASGRSGAYPSDYHPNSSRWNL